MSSELFESLESDVEELIGSIGGAMQGLSALKGEKQSLQVRAIYRDIEETEEMLKEMGLELNIQPAKYKDRLSGRLRKLENEIEEFKDILKEQGCIQNNNYSNRKSSSVISNSGNKQNIQKVNNNNNNNNDSDEEMIVDMDLDRNDPQRQRLIQAHKMLDISNQRIVNSERIALESENIGIDILNELQAQRESLVRTSQALDNADRGLRQTDRTVTSMLRRNLFNKFIWFAICFVILAIIVISIVSKIT